MVRIVENGILFSLQNFYVVQNYLVSSHVNYKYPTGCLGSQLIDLEARPDKFLKLSLNL